MFFIPLPVLFVNDPPSGGPSKKSGVHIHTHRQYKLWRPQYILGYIIIFSKKTQYLMNTLCKYIHIHSYTFILHNKKIISALTWRGARYWSSSHLSLPQVWIYQRISLSRINGYQKPNMIMIMMNYTILMTIILMIIKI